MTCNCDNDGSNEYIIELNQQGAPGIKGEQGEQGYSPVVDYTSDNNALQLNIVNEQNTVTTPEIPLKSYTDNQLTGKLNKDGSNADNPIIINGLRVRQQRQDLPVYLSSNTTGGVCITNNTNTYLTLVTNELSYRNGASDVIFELFGQYTAGTSQLASNKDFYFNNWNNSKFYYGYSGNYNEIATVNQIPTVGNGTITFTQGGVTKGTFTTNQSGNTTINLDSGASNPLEIKTSDGTRVLSLGVDNSTKKVDIYYGIVREGSTFAVPILPIYQVASPLVATDNGGGLYSLSVNTMTGSDSITGGAAGLVPAPSAGDQDKFLKGDGTWDTVGGGGSSYTAGTGIDITNDTISVDESVVMTTGNQSTINFGAKQFSIVTIANGFNANAGLLGKKNVSGSLYLAQVSSSDDIILGDGTAPLYLMGSNNRPKYTGGNITAQDLALYSDIPTNYLTTNTSQTITTGTKTMANGTSQVFINGSSLDIRGNNTLFLRGASQAQGGYLGLAARSRDTVNDVAINVIRLQANTTGDLANLRLQGYDLYNSPYLYNGFTRLGQVNIGSGDINITTESGVELQYNGNKVATVNDIPDLSIINGGNANA